MRTIKDIESDFKSIDENLCLSVDEVHFYVSLTKTSKRSKYGYVVEYSYRCKNLDQLHRFLEDDIIKRRERIVRKKDEALAKRYKVIVARDSVKEGDIFNCSWGYEQTNQEFFKIVGRPTKSTALVQKIGYDSVEVTSHSSEDVVINENIIIGKPFKVTLTGASFKISSFQYAFREENKTRRFHRSWGY